MKSLLAALLVLLACGPAAAGLNDGLVAHWPLNGSGADLGPRALNGYVSGAAGAADAQGVPGAALFFDGDDDVIEVPDQGFLDPPALTVAAWIKPERSSQWARIVDKYDHVNEAGWNLHLVSDTYVGFEFRTQTDEHFGVQTVTRLSPGQWHFVAATWDGATLRIYQDGRLENEAPAAAPLRPASRMLTLGNGFDGYHDWPYAGAMDEVRVYARALSEAEIQALAISPASGGAPGGPGPGGHHPPDAQGCPCPDSDHDGVPDAWDGCSGTPPGAMTDSRGCPEQGR